MPLLCLSNEKVYNPFAPLKQWFDMFFFTFLIEQTKTFERKSHLAVARSCQPRVSPLVSQAPEPAQLTKHN